MWPFKTQTKQELIQEKIERLEEQLLEAEKLALTLSGYTAENFVGAERIAQAMAKPEIIRLKIKRLSATPTPETGEKG